MIEELEHNMIVNAITVRLLNEVELRTEGMYHVVIETDDTVKLYPVRENTDAKSKWDFDSDDSSVITLSEDAANGTQKLSSFKFLHFVQPVFNIDKKRQRKNAVSKNERLAELFKDITPEDIAAFLKGRTDGKAD